MWWICVLQSGATHVVYCQAFYSIKFFRDMGSTDVDICYLLHLWVSFCNSFLVKSVVISPTCVLEWFCSWGLTFSLPCVCSSCQSSCIKAGSDPQEAQGDICDGRGTDADVFQVLSLNSSFVPLIDCLLPMFSVMRVFSEREAVTLGPLASLSSISCLGSAHVSEWDQGSCRHRHIALGCCRSLQNSYMTIWRIASLQLSVLILTSCLKQLFSRRSA